MPDIHYPLQFMFVQLKLLKSHRDNWEGSIIQEEEMSSIAGTRLSYQKEQESGEGDE